jgi:hypothetical protein
MFVHFVKSGAAASSHVAFQSEQPLLPAASELVPGQVLSSEWTIAVPRLPAGIYSLRVGLYSPGTGQRFSLVGQDDGSRRYLLGNLAMDEIGMVTFAVSDASEAHAESRESRKVIDFGPVATDGMVMLRREDNSIKATTYPKSRDVMVLLSTQRFPRPREIACDGDRQPISAEQSYPGYWQLSLKGHHSCEWTATAPSAVQK